MLFTRSLLPALMIATFHLFAPSQAIAKVDCDALYKQGLEKVYNDLAPQLEIIYAQSEAYLSTLRDKIKNDKTEYAIKLREFYGVDPATDKEIQELKDTSSLGNHQYTSMYLLNGFLFSQKLDRPSGLVSCNYPTTPLLTNYSGYVCEEPGKKRTFATPYSQIDAISYIPKKGGEYEISQLKTNALDEHVFYMNPQDKFKLVTWRNQQSGHDTFLNACTKVNKEFTINGKRKKIILSVCSHASGETWDTLQTGPVIRDELSILHQIDAANTVVAGLPKSCQRRILGYKASIEDPTGGSGGGGSPRSVRPKRTAMAEPKF